MRTLSQAELGSQIVLELPQRELMGAVFWISGSGIDIGLLENLLNDSFTGWSISILDDNHASVTVQDDLTETQVSAFCNETVSAMSVECGASLS